MGSFWDPFGEPKSTPNPKGVWEKSVLFSILWSLGPQKAPRPSQEGSWGGLGPLLGALGPSWDGLGRVLGRLEGVFEGRFGVVLEFGLLIQFIDSNS